MLQLTAGNENADKSIAFSSNLIQRILYSESFSPYSTADFSHLKLCSRTISMSNHMHLSAKMSTSFIHNLKHFRYVFVRIKFSNHELFGENSRVQQ